MRNKIITLCGFVVAAVLATSFIGKTLALGDFAATLAGIHWIPKPMTNSLILVVPVAELLSFCLLLYQPLRHVGLWLALSLFILFTVFLVVETWFHPAAQCNCMGALLPTLFRQNRIALIRNIFLIWIASTAILRKDYTASSTGESGPELSFAKSATTAPNDGESFARA